MTLADKKKSVCVRLLEPHLPWQDLLVKYLKASNDRNVCEMRNQLNLLFLSLERTTFTDKGVTLCLVEGLLRCGCMSSISGKPRFPQLYNGVEMTILLVVRHMKDRQHSACISNLQIIKQKCKSSEKIVVIKVKLGHYFSTGFFHPGHNSHFKLMILCRSGWRGCGEWVIGPVTVGSLVVVTGLCH